MQLSKNWSHRAWNDHWKTLKCWALPSFLRRRLWRQQGILSMTLGRLLQTVFFRNTNQDSLVSGTLELTPPFWPLFSSPRPSALFFSSSPTHLKYDWLSKCIKSLPHTFLLPLLHTLFISRRSEFEHFNLSSWNRFVIPMLLVEPFTSSRCSHCLNS